MHSDYPKFQTPHYGKQAEFRTAIANTGSPSAQSALEALDAMLWVLAGGMFAQALFLAHHTVEIALKGLLEEISVLLVVDRPGYDLAKLVVRERLSTHRLGQGITKFIDPDQYDPDRTCGLVDAFSRVNEMIPFAITSGAVQSLNKLRNQIVHHGGTEENDFPYLDVILNVALPLLVDLYNRGYSLDVRDWILAPRARELDVAREYLSLAKANATLPRTGILHTFQRKYFADVVLGVGNLLFTEEGEQRDVLEWMAEVNQAARTKAERKGWVIIGEAADTDCVVCGTPSCIVAIPPRPRIENGKEVYDPIALHCPACDLLLEPTHSELARLHYGPISEDRLGPEAWAKEVPR
jgi:hypothetical protein